MRMMKPRSIVVLLAILTMAVPLSPGEASAQSLLEALFGGNRYKTRRQEPPPQPQPEPRQRAEAPKISAPSYYTYKPDSLTRIDFSAVLAAETEGAAAPAAHARPGTGFADARSALEDFELYAEADIAEAVAAHYAAEPRFIWVNGFHRNLAADEALAVLDAAEEWGLDRSDYTVSVPPDSFALDAPDARMAALARFEMALTARVLRYVRDAHGGRVDPNRMSGYYDFDLKTVDYGAVLKELASSDDVVADLKAWHPQNRQYAALKDELAALRASSENEIVVDPDTFVRPGQSDPEFAKILTLIEQKTDAEFRDAHGDVLVRHLGSAEYADELVPVVKAAQEAHGLTVDGIVGPRTVDALAGRSRAERIGKVRVAMEQLRWLPSDLGSRNVMINAASFKATYTENGEPKLTMRAVVGKTSNQTSFFTDEIEYVQFNPYWGVPQSILVNEMLPKLRNDPGYLDRSGYEVTDARGRRVSSASIDWWQYGANIPFDVRQLPGKSNALGELKIMFPNKHAIYMHDTPAKHLFERDTRAYSHGCVRLAEPRAMAAAVMGWDEDRIVERLNQGHNKVDLPSTIPVYVAYFTAWPDADGMVGYHHDVYDRDARLKTALEKTHDARSPSS